MPLNATVRARVDEKLKNSVEDILQHIGLTTSQAINIFLKKIVTERGIPFELKTPSPKLKNAINEAKNNQGSFHNNIEDMIKDLKSWNIIYLIK